MKLTALTLLGIVCAMTGQYIAFSLNRRVALLEKIQLMISQMESHLNYLSTPSEMLIEALCENTQLRGLSFLDSCRLRIAGGEDFRTAWRASLSDRSCTHFLKMEDVAMLNSFGEMFGATDTAGQLSNCRLHLQLAGERLDEAREIRERYGSLSMGMGIIAGIGVIIILI